MPDVRFIPRDEAARLQWLKKFASGVQAYATDLRIDPSSVAQLTADAAVYEHVCRTRDSVIAYAKGLTSWRNAARNGTHLGEFPQAPQIAPPPPGAQAGIFTRAAKLAQQIKATPGYTSVHGVAMGIIATPKRPVDYTTVQPTLEITAAGGQPPVVRWHKGRMEMLELHVSRDGGPFVFLSVLWGTTWRDPSPLPPPGTAQVWRYRGIFVGDDQKKLGQWSNEVSVAVSG